MKDYKRLTERTDGNHFAYSKQGHFEIVNRLCELEDKIEQGLILELPCPLGTTVYDIKWWDTIEEAVKVDGKMYFRNVRKHKVAKSKFGLFDIDLFGKEVFLTKAEAEAKLQELRGGQ